MNALSVIVYTGIWALLNQILSFCVYVLAFGREPIKLGRVKPLVNSDAINTYVQQQIGQDEKIETVQVDKSDELYESEMEKKSQGPQNVSLGVLRSFTCTVVMSLNFIALMMVEITVGLENVFPGILTRFFIDVLVLLLSVVQPFIMVNLVLHKQMTPNLRSKKQMITSTVVTMAWLFFLGGFGVLSRSFTPSHSLDDTRSIIEKKTNEISILGITTLAMLSGVGCISTPWELFSLRDILSKVKEDDYLTPKKKTVTVQTINHTIMGLNQTSSLIRKRKRELSNLLVSNAGTIYNNPNKSSDHVLLGGEARSLRVQKAEGIFHKVQSFASLSSLSLSSEQKEEKELNEELSNLSSLQQNIHDELLKQVSQYRRQRQEEQGSRAISGRILKFCRHAFGIYCIYRFANVVLMRSYSGIFYGGTDSSDAMSLAKTVDEEYSPPSKDALAITLSKLILSMTSASVSEAQMVNQISFILSGSLFLCSFSSVLTTLKSFSRFLPASIWASSMSTKYSLQLFLLSQLLGIYVFATALLIRTNLPLSMSHQISKILSLSGRAVTNETIAIKEVQLIDAWFDKVFLISGFVTLASLGIKRYIDHNDVYYDNNYDEELFLENTSSKI